MSLQVKLTINLSQFLADWCGRGWIFGNKYQAS
jgi:hypothetical protein